MFCAKCGTHMNDDWCFCPKCGNCLHSNSIAPDNQPKTTKGERKFKPGGFLSNIVLTIDDSFLKYRGAYGDASVVPVKGIVSVNTTPNGFGKADVVIIGNGSEIARISKIPSSWAQDIMMWITQELEL